MKKLIVVIAFIVFLTPLLVGSETPPAPVTVYFDDGTSCTLLSPPEMGDFTVYPFLQSITISHKPGGPIVGFAAFWGTPPDFLFFVLFDQYLKPRAIGCLIDGKRADWIYNKDGTPIKADIEELKALTAQMEAELDQVPCDRKIRM